MKKSSTLPLFLLGALIALITCWPAAAARAADPPSFAPAVDYSVGDGPNSVITGDFNNDGKKDLATVNSYSNTVSILLGTEPAGTFAAAANYIVGMFPSSLTTGYFNADSIPDIVTANSASNDVSILLGAGDGTFVAAGNCAVGYGPVSVTTFNAGGKPYIVTANMYTANVSILRGNGDGTFAMVGNTGVGLYPRLVTTGDFNYDGKTDLATANYFSGNVSILLGTEPAGTFAAAVNYVVGVNPYSVTTGDFNADGKPDLVAANTGSSNVSILLGKDPAGTFCAAGIYPVGSSPESVTTGDFNADGKLDIVTANYGSHNVSILQGTGDGTFGTAENFSVGYQPISVTAGDFNNDGKLDLATANSYSGSVSVLLAFVLKANAGPDQTVNEEDLVTLDGSASTGMPGTTLTYQWSQIGEPGVELDLTDQQHPTFTAPLVPKDGKTLSFTLVVSDGTATSEPDTVNITVKDVNHAPIAAIEDCLPVIEGALVKLKAGHPMSYDPDGDPLTFKWTQTYGTPVTLDLGTAFEPSFTAPLVGWDGETLTFQLIVNDGSLDSIPATVDVKVENVNHQPTADAGADQTSDEEAIVTLNGTGSKDPDGDLITYVWWQTWGPEVVLSDPTSPTPTFMAPPVGPDGETLVFRLVVSDPVYESVEDMVTITVLNTYQLPVCALAVPSVELLWPPVHKMIEVGIAGVSDPDNAQVAITVNSVTQDEPVNGLGDGDTSPDAVLLGSKALLRQERSGNGNGRVYQIHFTAVNGQGGSCQGNVAVCVPKDAKNKTCVDDGSINDSTLP